MHVPPTISKDHLSNTQETEDLGVRSRTYRISTTNGWLPCSRPRLYCIITILLLLTTGKSLPRCRGIPCTRTRLSAANAAQLVSTTCSRIAAGPQRHPILPVAYRSAQVPRMAQSGKPSMVPPGNQTGVYYIPFSGVRASCT